MTEENRKRILYCSVCGFEFKNKATWTSHLRTHNPKAVEIVGKCNICGSSLSFFGYTRKDAIKKGECKHWICEDCWKLAAPIEEE